MTKLILVNVGKQEIRVAVSGSGRLDEFFIERINAKTIVGNIYKGRIDSIARSLNACFVDIGLSKKGFLYLSQPAHQSLLGDEEIEGIDISSTRGRAEKGEEFKVGQEVIVQVVKEQIGNKGPRLTTKISLPGRYLVLLPYESNTGISRRIDEDVERQRLKALMQSLRLPSDYGFVVRTLSVGAVKKQLHRDAKFLIKLWKRISQVARRKKPPALLHEEFDLVMRTVRDSFTEEVTNIFVDAKREFHVIRKFVRVYSPPLLRRILFYRGQEPLFEKFKVEEEVEKIYERKVNLKSGGYIYIEPTEGLVAVDVNSGRFRATSSSKGAVAQEEMAFKVNREAAVEIVRQLRLRDLGGLIVIDFIDMTIAGHRNSILADFKRLLKLDKAKTDVIRISQFGILEMTRQRQRKSAEGLSYQICPYCAGRGKVKSVATIAITCLRLLTQTLTQKERVRGKKLLVSLHPQVAEFMRVEYEQNLKDLQSRTKSTIILNPSPHLHLEKIVIE